MTRLFFTLLTLFFLNGPAMGENSDFRRCTIAAKTAGTTEQLLLGSSQKLADHHIFPQTYRGWFQSRDIQNIDDFTVTLDHNVTHLKAIHGNGNLGQMPGKWNKQWLDFKTANPNASPLEIYQQGGKMMNEFGINHLEIHPYGK